MVTVFPMPYEVHSLRSWDVISLPVYDMGLKSGSNGDRN
jgi:hypothetical protein